MKERKDKKVITFISALIICLLIVPLSRFISPVAIVDASQIYLSWLPLSVIFAMILLFGRQAIVPIILSFAIVKEGAI